MRNVGARFEISDSWLKANRDISETLEETLTEEETSEKQETPFNLCFLGWNSLFSYHILNKCIYILKTLKEKL